MSRQTLAASDIATLMRTFGTALERHRETINRLNVYPVPDGDTGTNMCLTVESVLQELAPLDGEADLPAVCAAIAHGSLMGARGNSGVILCQLLRGMSDVFAASRNGVDGGTLASGLEEANVAARRGVMKPVEGTILTVAAAAAEASAQAVAEGGELAEVARSARAAAAEALKRTPEMLPVLEKAGVVDAGAAGLLLLFDSLLYLVDDRVMPDELPLSETVRRSLERGATALRAENSAEATGAVEEGATAPGLRYEVMYLLEAPDDLVPAFREVWAGIGDSIVVVGGDGLWNCHVHTDDVGASIEAALDVGRPRNIRVTDLLEQVEEESWVRAAAQGVAGSPAPEEAGPVPVTSVIAVATGEGVSRIFRSLGVHDIVPGGQSMNPSTAEILDIIAGVEGREVVILPNNKNIYAVAAQAAEISPRPCRVVPTPGVQEGFAALLEYDPEAGADENAESMAVAASRVVAGEVTQAVRVSDTALGLVHAGQWIGLSRAGIESVADSAADAACALLDRIVTSDHEIVTVIEGAGAHAADTRRITEWLAANRPDASVDLHHGGQPLYPYLVAAE